MDRGGFLAQVAADLYERYGDEVASLHVVFPSRRARLFFGEALARIISRPIWQPTDASIDSLAEELSGLVTGDRLRIVAELYKIYAEFHPSETFDGFYFWGELLLGDFDSIDKYLIDADTLFSNLVDLHSLDNRFDYLSEEQRAVIERFWGSLSERRQRDVESANHSQKGSGLSPEQGDFLRVWRTLAPVYHRFKARLRELGIAYQGMVYREAAERIQREEVPQIPDRHYVIAGFNALSKCEQVMLDYLQKNFETDFYWDYDNYFLHDQAQEAGRFVRDNLRRFPSRGQLSGGHDNFLKSKHIRSVSTASDVLQCKYAGLALKDFPHDKNTAIVLCDEGLLTPLLWSLPSDIQAVNITMGYPLRLHPSYTYLERRLVELLKRRGTDWRQISEKLLENQSAENENNAQNTQFESLISEHIRALSETLNDLDIEISPKTYATLLRRTLQSVRVPFEGEPLEGVQIMGILETRALDFDNIIFLSAGDGTMPGNLVGAPSFIPYNLKIAYGLPTPEHHEGVWAYHFFRLIGRTKNIELVWSSTSDERSIGEPSRYILQLDYESPHNVEKESVSVDVNLSPPQPIVVPKDVNKIPRKLSPSLFSTYIECPLKFYFRAVAGLRAEEEPTDVIDNALFGSILHLAMQKLYAPLVGVPNPQEQLHALIGSPAVESAVSGAIAELCALSSASTPENIGGDIALVHRTISGYIYHRILPLDASRDEDYTIEKLEEPLSAEYDFATSPSEAQTVTFSGKTDRIDRLSDNTLRVVDYKTGSPRARASAEFQIALYALMLRSSYNAHGAAQNVQTALYYVRQLPEVIESEGYSVDFEQLLRETLRELFDPAAPFVQCENPAPCEWCDFNTICRR